MPSGESEPIRGNFFTVITIGRPSNIISHNIKFITNISIISSSINIFAFLNYKQPSTINFSIRFSISEAASVAFE